jgi:hypothetical protein
MSELWLPGAAGPQDEFVTRLHRRIERFAEAHGIAQAVVEVELRDGARFKLDSISPDPGYGFVALVPHAGEDDVPGELIVPIGAIARVELRAMDEPEPQFGFTLPPGPLSA